MDMLVRGHSVQMWEAGVGIYALLSVVVNQYMNQRAHVPIDAILWYCDVSMLLLSAAFFLRSAGLATVVLATAIPAQFLWIIDFFYFIGGSSMGRTAAMETWGPGMFATSVHLHMVLIPLAMYAVYRFGFAQHALRAVLAASAIVLSATFFFTPAEYNINCVFYGCDEVNPGSGYAQYFMYTLGVWGVAMTMSFCALRAITRRLRWVHIV